MIPERLKWLRSTSFWLSLLLVSLLIHLLFSWQAVRTIGKSGERVATQEEAVEVIADPLAPPPEEEKPPEPEKKEDLVFEDPIEFEPPPVLVPTTAVEPPPPDVNLAMEAAAGGQSSAGSQGAGGQGAAGLEVPLLANTVTAGQGLAGFGTGIGNGLSNSTNRFAAYVKGLRETGLDVVFVVDTTGSMGWIIAELNERISDIVDSVRLLVPISRFGVVAYRDFDSPEYVTRVQPLTFSLRRLQGFLGTLRSVGGGDVSEAIDEGLHTAVRQSGWRMGAKKVIILIGDAPPRPDARQRMMKTAKEFGKGGGDISALDISHEGNPALLEAIVGRKVDRGLFIIKPMLAYQEVAQASNGVAATMDGDVRVTRQLVNLIMGGQFANEMALLLEGL